jgi:protocatechuate 3,4-dioxygenase beta subunit
MVRLVNRGVPFFCLLLAFVSVTYSEPQAASPAQSGQLCQLEGVVLDATTGQPVRKISIDLYRRSAPMLYTGEASKFPNSYSTISGPSGRFAFSAIVPGEYVLAASGNDYPEQAYGKRNRYTGGDPIKLAPGEDRTGIDFRLEPGVVISGKVTDEDGDPLENVTVGTLVRGHNGVRVQFTQGNLTNDLGEYRIFGLHAGPFLMVAAPSGQTRGSSNGEIYEPELYPGTTDPSQATFVDARPGDVLSDVNIALTPVSPARIGLLLINGATGLPDSSAYPNLFPTDETWRKLANVLYRPSTPQGQGRFEIEGIAPGSYVLTASSQIGQTSLYGQLPIQVSAGENLDGLQLTLTRAIQLSGQVTADSSPGFNFSSLAVSLKPDPSNPLPPNLYNSFGSVQRDGTFVMQNVPPGKYRVNVEGFPPQYYLKSATLEGADVLENGLTLVAGSQPGELALFLSLDGGSITGTVLGDDKPVPGATVVLIPDPPRRDRDDLYSTTQTDSMGRFAMPGLPEGDYKLFAWEDLNGHGIRDPDFIRLFEDRGKAVEIRLRQQQTVQLQVIPAKAVPRE